MSNVRKDSFTIEIGICARCLRMLRQIRYKHSDQSNIIRTSFSQWETGSDLLFLSTDMRKHTSETELRSSRPANRASTGHGRRIIRKMRTEVRQDNKNIVWITGVLGARPLFKLNLGTQIRCLLRQRHPKAPAQFKPSRRP